MQARHSAEAGTHKSPGIVAVDQRELCVQFPKKFVANKTGMPQIPRVFDQAIGRLCHGNDHCRDFQSVNKVIQYRLKIGVMQIIRTVMDDQ